MKKYFIIAFMFVLHITCLPATSKASLFICQKGVCNYADETFSSKPWLRQLKTLFKTANTRLDFCEAAPDSHLCLSDGLKWMGFSPLMQVGFEIPVARTLPQQNTLLIDYLVRANESLPSCHFSTTTFEQAENYTIRIVSHSFSCNLTEVGTTQLQNTFFIDYIDFDNAVIGGQYTIQTHGEIQGTASGYTLIRFRDGNTLKPLVAVPEYGPMPPAPTAEQAFKIQEQLYPTEDQEWALTGAIKDWWQELKDSFNADKPKTSKPYQQRSLWNRFTDTLSKIIYLEPLN